MRQRDADTRQTNQETRPRDADTYQTRRIDRYARHDDIPDGDIRGRGAHQDQIPRKTTYREMLTRPSSCTNLCRNLENQEDKDREIKELKAKLHRYEQNEPSPKNVNTPRGGGQDQQPSTSSRATNQEILDLISTTMESLQNYRKQLVN